MAIGTYLRPMIYARRNDILEITLANGGDDFANQYWSSEEVDAGNAYLISLNDGSKSIQSKANSYGVRAVRKF